ncbi:MAG TPA: cyanophycin synthetase, partial [Tepidisphaeraceae bacterium]|nr:cyanophycin synthetase [Tepidisphaeraceae bacterium]
RPDDIAVLNAEDAGSLALASRTPAHVVRFATQNRKPFELIVPGKHNQSNAQAAWAAASQLGVPREPAEAALKDFRGLAHRLELVHESNGVQYFNDSIATVPEAAIAALNSFPPHRVIQIVGGSDKQIPMTAMCGALMERAKAVLCIGQIGKALAATMSGSAPQNSAAVYDCGDLPTAMKLAKQIAIAGDVVLLSPGSASYGEFVNFEERGRTFAKLAKES